MMMVRLHATGRPAAGRLDAWHRRPGSDRAWSLRSGTAPTVAGRVESRASASPAEALDEIGAARGVVAGNDDGALRSGQACSRSPRRVTSSPGNDDRPARQPGARLVAL
jgi:hypothetical protein